MDKDRVAIGETAGTYKLNFVNENNKKECYIGKTKLKIKKSYTAWKRKRLNKINTAIAHLNQKQI